MAQLLEPAGPDPMELEEMFDQFIVGEYGAEEPCSI